MTTPAETLLNALRKKAGFETVSMAEPSPNQLRVLGRVLEDQAGMNMNNWKILMYRFYTTMEARPWKVDFSKSYFVQPETKRLVFAWRLIFQGEGLAQHYPELVKLAETSPIAARGEVTEMLLPGADASRHSTHGGKRGAGPAGKVLVGPLAVQAKMRGG